MAIVRNDLVGSSYQLPAFANPIEVLAAVDVTEEATQAAREPLGYQVLLVYTKGWDSLRVFIVTITPQEGGDDPKVECAWHRLEEFRNQRLWFDVHATAVKNKLNPLRMRYDDALALLELHAPRCSAAVPAY